MKMPHNLHINIKLHSAILKTEFHWRHLQNSIWSNYPHKYMCLYLA